MTKIGVLALQGAFKEHLSCLQKIPNIEAILVNDLAGINSIDGLILPGGESTAMGKLLIDFDILNPLRKLIQNGLPVWGTCAGMILLAKSINNDPTVHLGCMDICVQRNAYGSQLDSFSTEIIIDKVSHEPIPLVFIRAPYVTSVGSNVKILAEVNSKIVAVEENNMIATSFHPELTTNLAIHKYFVKKVNLYIS